MELRCRSAFSFLEGASNPEDLVERAADLGYPTLALGDRDGLYGAPRFHQAAQAAGLRGSVGARVGLDGGASLLLLVESPRGYRNLSRLLTVGHARAGKRAERARSEAKPSEGGPPQGPRAERARSEPKVPKAEGRAAKRSRAKLRRTCRAKTGPRKTGERRRAPAKESGLPDHLAGNGRARRRAHRAGAW